MSEPIESYALLGDMQTAALVSRRGCVDWLCMPRFDSPALFASLLGDDENGAWRIAPTGAGECSRRRYDDHTLVLHTDWETTEGAARVIDFMPPRGEAPDVVRIVEGLSGRVEMTCEIRIRYDYGSVVPWVRRRSGGFTATAGPDSIYLATPVRLHGRDFVHRATFSVEEGERVPFVMTWQPSNLPPPQPVDAEQALADTYVFWHEWLSN
ncbi:MAG TPA: trehalase-like domain-containing protein, partial [Mycobacteriales bacterium]|nr:trehalase-like domain-containing protein [Mycobacteriales bacterium]